MAFSTVQVILSLSREKEKEKSIKGRIKAKCIIKGKKLKNPPICTVYGTVLGRKKCNFE